MNWRRHAWIRTRLVCGNYHIDKEHSNLGEVWRLYHNEKEYSQSTTLTAAKASAIECENKLRRTA